MECNLAIDRVFLLQTNHLEQIPDANQKWCMPDRILSDNLTHSHAGVDAQCNNV